MIVTENQVQEKNGITLIAVTKETPVSKILDCYHQGHRSFGDQKAKRLFDKYEQLPKDIQWHMLGQLEPNKVRFIAPFVMMIHSVDSIDLFKEINKQAKKNDRIIECLIPFSLTDDCECGLNEEAIIDMLDQSCINSMKNIRIRGLMGVTNEIETASKQIQHFRKLISFFNFLKTNYFSATKSFDTKTRGAHSAIDTMIKQGRGAYSKEYLKDYNL